MSNAIDLDNVTRRFGRTLALDGVSLSVPENSVCGLLGRNGAGKTTVMSLVAGQDRPSKGTVQVCGQNPFEHESILSRISFVRDNQRYPDKYLLKHVLRIAPEFASRWSDDLAEELVERLRIPAHTPIKKLSRGQLSSVAIVLGLASRAPVTLLDEPYLGLDITGRALFHDVLLRDVIEHPRTVVLSTHLVEESEALFDRVVILDRGRVSVEDEIDRVRELAFTASGTADAVAALSRGRSVMRSHAIGGLRSVTVHEPLNNTIRDEATRLNVEVASASIAELVAAFGEDLSPEQDRTEGVPA